MIAASHEDLVEALEEVAQDRWPGWRHRLEEPSLAHLGDGWRLLTVWYSGRPGDFEAIMLPPRKEK